MIFVYGTLQTGERLHPVMKRHGARFVAKTRTVRAYRLVSLGAFPGMLEGGDTSVTGELYQDSPELLAELDRIEGHPSFYRRKMVGLLGPVGEAEAYVLQSKPDGTWKAIRHGDWLRFRR